MQHLAHTLGATVCQPKRAAAYFVPQPAENNTSSKIFEKPIVHRKSRFSSVNYAWQPNITELSRKAQFDSDYSQLKAYPSTCQTW